jgi:hypothetical protein
MQIICIKNLLLKALAYNIYRRFTISWNDITLRDKD